MGPTEVLVWDLCRVGVPEVLTVARGCDAEADTLPCSRCPDFCVHAGGAGVPCAGVSSGMRL